MARMPGLSDLRIPEQKQQKSWFDIRPKQVTAWIESLPLGDTDQTLKQLFSVLTHTNRVEIPATARMKMLEQLHETIHFAIDALKKNYTGQSFPLNSRALKYVDRTLAMYTELANAYKIACTQLLDRHRLFQKKTLSAAIFRALETLGKLQISYYQIYAPEPTLLWTDIHTLYSLAEQYELQDIPIRDVDLQHADMDSIAKKYKQILLLSLSNPYHLGKNEVLEVESRLQTWANLCRLINPELEDKGEAHFAFCLDCDRPPVELSMIKTLEVEIYRLIDTSALTHYLRQQLTLAQHGTEANPVISINNISRQANLLKQLIHAWDTRDKRRFSRSRAEEGIDVSIGLNSTHYIIEEMIKPAEEPVKETPATNADADFIDDTRNPLDFSHTTFSIEPVIRPHEQGNFWNPNDIRAQDGSKQSQSGAAIPEPTYQYHPWKTLNAGAGGYCLLWDHDKSSNAQIGEIVGIRESNDNNELQWRIGVVRWMQYVRNQGLKLGIQILSPSASTLQSRLMKGSAKNRTEYSCLSLPEIKAIHQPASILTPSLHYKVGDALILNDHGRMSSVQLTRLVEKTGNYARFQYKPIKSRNNTEDS